jgi:hypothetical protein
MNEEIEKVQIISSIEIPEYGNEEQLEGGVADE